MYYKYELDVIGRCCATLRKSKGYTQDQVAEAVDTSPQNISKFERGHNNSAVILAWYVVNGLDPLELWGAFGTEVVTEHGV